MGRVRRDGGGRQHTRRGRRYGNADSNRTSGDADSNYPAADTDGDPHPRNQRNDREQRLPLHVQRQRERRRDRPKDRRRLPIHRRDHELRTYWQRSCHP